MSEEQRILDFMLQCISDIREYTQMDRHSFFNDRKTQDAAIRALYVLTDVSKRLSDETKQAMPEVNWREMVGFRNYLVHEYLGDLDLEVVWAAIEKKLNGLEASLKRYQESL